MGNHVIERTWERMLEPVCIFGNLYFVGTIPASTHILKTKDGLIMSDSGYQETLYMVIDNMYRLGLNPHDIKMIIHTHGHVDHFGATAALQKMTGAKAGIAELDKTYVTGEENLSWADELDLTLIPFTPDFIYTDGDVLSFGGVDIKCIATPGHTPGTTSFVFDVTDGRDKKRCKITVEYAKVDVDALKKKGHTTFEDAMQYYREWLYAVVRHYIADDWEATEGHDEIMQIVAEKIEKYYQEV